MLSCQCQVQCQESWERRKYLIVDEIIITQLMTEKKSKKNTKREIRKVIYRIHSVVFCVWKMNLSSQSYFMVQCIMSHSGSVWHLFLGERCTTILKKKKVRYFWSMRFVLLFASLLNLLAVRQHTRSCIQYRPTEEKKLYTM